ncbi:MAG: S26 family signal peptidase [Actinomycetota bacterium]
MLATYHRRRRWVGVALTGTAVAAVVAWTTVRRRPFRVVVEGDSMAPTLLAGDRALALGGSRPARGDVMVVAHPDRPGYEMVKRLVAIPGDRVGGDRRLGPDEYWVEGDHADASTDSRHFGPVGRDELTAKVLLIYWPPTRRRLL